MTESGSPRWDAFVASEVKDAVPRVPIVLSDSLRRITVSAWELIELVPVSLGHSRSFPDGMEPRSLADCEGIEPRSLDDLEGMDPRSVSS